jgi:serine/threonine-protein kinase
MELGQGPAVKTVGGFEVISKIGHGAMGTVFKARQPGLDRLVALKVLPPRIASHDPAFIDRFIREARVSAKLNHPNIVQGIAVGQDAVTKLYYFAMEFIDGPTVKQVLGWQKRIEERRALEIILGVANALVCAHKAGIVHRDIKPDNIMLSSNGEIKVTDLGLARSVSMGSGIHFTAENDETKIILGPSADAALTVIGAAIGTPSYMAPEAAKAEGVDIRTDLYGAGATLYHMLTGELPFKGANGEETMKLLVTAPVPDPRKANPAVRPETAQLVMRLMQKDPARRLQVPEELVSALEGLMHFEESTVRTSNSGIPRARRQRFQRSSNGGGFRQAVIACLVAFAVGAAGIYLLMRNGHLARDKSAENNIPPVPPVVKGDGEKKSDGEKTVDGVKSPPTALETQPTKVVEPRPVVDSASKLPVAAKSIDDQAFDVWENLVDTKRFREATQALQNFCLANKLNDTATHRLHSKLEEAIGERMRRVVTRARDLIDSGHPDEAVKELTGVSLPPGEEDPAYRSALDDARAAASGHNGGVKSPVKDLQSRWLADIQKAMRDGAKKLADGRDFMLKCSNHEPYHLGKGRVTFKGLSKDEAFINVGVTTDEEKLVPTIESIGFQQLMPDTRFELICMSADDRSALAGVLLKWAVTQHLSGVGSAAEIQKILAQAKADGAPDALLADARTLLAAGASKSAPPPNAPVPPAPVVCNPFSKAKVNDFVEYRNGPDTVRMQVLKKDNASVTFKMTEYTAQGAVKQPEPPALQLPLQENLCFYDLFCPGHKVVSDVEDTVTLSNKTYKCRHVQVKYNDPITKKEATAKLWFSPEVPLFGLVRWQNESGASMEFVKSGTE